MIKIQSKLSIYYKTLNMKIHGISIKQTWHLFISPDWTIPCHFGTNILRHSLFCHNEQNSSGKDNGSSKISGCIKFFTSIFIMDDLSSCKNL